MATPESDLVRACLAYLKMQGILAWRNNTGTHKVGKRFIRFGRSGSGDIIGILPGGRFLSIECKTGSNVESKAQMDFGAIVNRKGGLAVTVRSLEELEDALCERDLHTGKAI